MANWIIALLVAIGGGTWIYTKMLRQTGNNSSSSIISALAVGVLIFLLAFIALGFITK